MGGSTIVGSVCRLVANLAIRSEPGRKAYVPKSNSCTGEAATDG